jgi:hypothetical protein
VLSPAVSRAIAGYQRVNFQVAVDAYLDAGIVAPS